MNKTEAEKRLQERRKRTARKRGPAGLSFTASELLAVVALSAQGRTQQTVARSAGLSLSSFKRALEGDEKLRDSWDIGKAERREKRIRELEAQSIKGNTRATELLLRYEHRDSGPQTAGNGRGSTDINININADSPKAIDGRTYSAALLRSQHGAKPSNIIEHAPATEPLDLDPIASVKARQKKERERC